jgi:putative transposase
MLALQCELYNAALEERRGVWKVEHRTVTFFEQSKELTGLKDVRPEVIAMGVTVCRGTLKRLDRAYAGFFRRCQAGETPGFPRFKSWRRFDSLSWEDRNGWKLKPEVKRLRLHGLGEVKVHLHRPIQGSPRAITIRREGRRWTLTVRCIDVPRRPLPKTEREVGIDLGVRELVATSDGVLIAAPTFEKRASAKLANTQVELARKVKGSHNRDRARQRVADHHRKVRNQRKDFAHKLSRHLVNDYDRIVVENLSVKSMVRRPKPRSIGDGTFEPNGAAAKSQLNRSIHDAGWGQLLGMIAYKAEDAGRDLVVVNPKGTSQRCSSCGVTDTQSRRSRAVFRCTTCGHDSHADLNAARNILGAGRALRSSDRAGSN